MTNWSELSIFCSAIAGCVISLVLAIQKSKCVKISLCSGMCECDRNLNVVEDLESQLSNVQEIQTTNESKEKEGEEKTPRQSTTTPRRSSSIDNYRDTLPYCEGTNGIYRIPSN